MSATQLFFSLELLKTKANTSWRFASPSHMLAIVEFSTEL